MVVENRVRLRERKREERKRRRRVEGRGRERERELRCFVRVGLVGFIMPHHHNCTLYLGGRKKEYITWFRKLDLG